MPSSNNKISVVLPNLQEESIFKVIRQLKELLKGRDFEIIVVNKSSREYLGRLRSTGVKVIEQKVQSVESAIMVGMSHANGGLIVSTDADATHGTEGLLPGIRMVSSGSADLVLGNRFGNLTKGSMPAHVQAGNSFISSVYSFVYRRKVHDVLTGFFVMNRKVYEAIKDVKPYRAGIAFFAIEVAKRNFKIAEVPISYYPREHGKSQLAKSKVWYGVNVVTHIVRAARDYSPLLIFGGIGVVLIVIGLGFSIDVLFSYLSSGVFTTIGRALIAFMLFVLGFLSIMVGFILDLLLEIARRIER